MSVKTEKQFEKTDVMENSRFNPSISHSICGFSIEYTKNVICNSLNVTLQLFKSCFFLIQLFSVPTQNRLNQCLFTPFAQKGVSDILPSAFFNECTQGLQCSL